MCFFGASKVRDWRKILVSPDLSLEEGIKIMDQGALRVLLVINSEQKLLGTITDGDIRRALLKHLTLDAPLYKVMHEKPSVATLNWPKSRMRQFMQNKSLLHLPVIDNDGFLVGLETLDSLASMQKRTNPIFLMAGGFGTRLKPLTNTCPKPLLRVGDKPILQIILESFVNAGFINFYISTHYLPEMVRNYFGTGDAWDINIQYVHEDVPLGTGGALGLLPEEAKQEPLIMMNGDLLTNVDFLNLLDFHEQHQGIATLCVREYEQQIPYGVVELDGHTVKSICEKPTHKFFVNAGIYVLQPELVRSISKEKYLDMPTLLESQIKEKRKVSTFPIHEYWLDIGRMEDFQRAQTEIGNLF